MFGVYQIRCTANGKKYIGSSCADVERRIREHRSDLKIGRSSNLALQNDYSSYGEKYFKFEILEVTSSIEETLNREQHYLDRCFEYPRLLYNKMTVAGNAHKKRRPK